ncbi:MAG: N-alpha-acetyl diaminobutyric acid deacetylase DoeB [Chloroflexota bacterium]
MSAERSPVSTDVDFEQDGKQLSYLRVPTSRNDSAWGSVLVPVAVVKNGSGPTVLLVGGNHGGEYEGPVSLTKLIRALQPEEVQGRVIVLPALNMPAVNAGQRLSPLDNKDMNRVFPGRWDGTVTEVVAHYVHDAILPFCDAVIDLHSGGYSLSLMPYISMHYLDDEAQRQKTWAAMMAFQAPVALVMKEISGPGLLDYAVESQGKVFLCAEIGGNGTLDPRMLEIVETGTRNVLKQLGVLEGQPLMREDQGLPPPRLMEIPDPAYYHMALVDGIYESFYELGEWVEPDQPLGQIHFLQQIGREPRVVRAQRAGMLVGRRGPGFVRVGDTVAALACDLT